ncbi:MAG: hypothetical protein II174_03620 [Erysipelotrichaceae bacterium]|nr:hypothetical protein [Erysipelotrichaceae bacterium]
MRDCPEIFSGQSFYFVLEMKVYKCEKKFRIRYMLFGILVLIAMAYILISRRFFYSKAVYNIAFWIVGILLGVFYCLRGFLLRLELRDDEIYFWDGLVDFRHIKYDDLLKIEYNPEIRIRFYIRDERQTKFSIPNVFGEEKTMEILDAIKKKRKRIEVIHIDREKAIDTSKKIVRSKPIRKKGDKK